MQELADPDGSNAASVIIGVERRLPGLAVIRRGLPQHTGDYRMPGAVRQPQPFQ